MPVLTGPSSAGTDADEAGADEAGADEAGAVGDEVVDGAGGESD